jgi:hypothetical protein
MSRKLAGVINPADPAASGADIGSRFARRSVYPTVAPEAWLTAIRTYHITYLRLPRITEKRIRPVNPGAGLVMVASSDHSEGCLRGEDTAGFNPREAFFQGQELCDFPPSARVTEIG